MRRREGLRTDRAKQRAWEQRSRDRALAADRQPTRGDSALAAAREQVKRRARGWCEANWEGVCPPGVHPGQHAHHVVLRAQGGDHHPDNLLWLCHVVHRHAHDVDRAGAEARGIIRRREP